MSESYPVVDCIYSVGKHVRFLGAHKIATALGPRKCGALPFFRALSGCDIVYFFHGNGNKTICSERNNHWPNTFYSGCSDSACEEGSISGWVLLVTILHCNTRNTISICSGWTKNDNGKWDVFWTYLPEATEACRELIRCACKKGCCGQCRCLKAALKCTAQCFCAGNCDTK